MKNSEILQKHIEEVCDIKPVGGNDKRFFTYIKPIDENTGKSKRKVIMLSTKEKVEKAVIDFYKSLEKQEKQAIVTLSSLYDEWLNLKILESNSSNNADRLNCDWKKYYKKDAIINIDIKTLDTLTLETWALGIIKENELTRKQYNNMSTIIRQILDLAVRKRIISPNPFDNVKIKNKKIFRKPVTKTKDTEVFTYQEEVDMIQLTVKDFKETGYNAPLAICLNFFIGLRMGELVALKKTDIQGNYLAVQRSEIKNRVRTEQGNFTNKGFLVSDYLKMGDDVRYVFLPDEAKKLLNFIIQNNEDNNWYDDDYLFIHNNERIHEKAITCRMAKYCRYLGIIQKSLHKTRKTYISTLLDNNSISADVIRKMVGHKSLKTTYANYYFGRQETEDIENLFQSTLANKIPQSNAITETKK